MFQPRNERLQRIQALQLVRWIIVDKPLQQLIVTLKHVCLQPVLDYRVLKDGRRQSSYELVLLDFFTYVALHTKKVAFN